MHTFDIELCPIKLEQRCLRRGFIFIGNVRKFTKTGGTIKLEALVDPGTVSIIVGDTGVGIAPDEVPKLFTKFHRGTSTLEYEYEGTGIGLYATKLVVEHHGGTIEAKSDFGKGSTFTAKLPILPEA